jgi:Uncharacterised nucleotidyltransferase
MPKSGEMTATTLAAALRGAVPSTPPTREWPQLVAAAKIEGVLPLLADAAESAGWDTEFRARVRASVLGEAALSIVAERELRTVLDALGEDNIVPLLFKGAHLAFTVYPSPDRRPRVDTDLLIKESDRDGATRCLRRIGYLPAMRVTGDVAFGQCQYWRTDRTGAAHTIDLHWRIANPKAFGGRITYDELRRTAVAIPQLGSHAYAPSATYALLIACVHRTAHHADAPRLIWLYDIHLLASRLSEREWLSLVEIASDRGVAPVVAAGLEHAREALAASVPPAIVNRLRSHTVETDADVLAFLDGAPPQIRIAWSDLRRTQGWRARARFVREHLFPPASYVQERYQSRSHAMLPLLYAHRIATGGVKWLRGSVRP